MTASWDEIKKLAADFQKVQESSTPQQLSERNCVEIIHKLTESKLLDIIFTNDGKEYVTPQHLCTEIKDELHVHDGRINLVELSKILNVDLSQISRAAAEVVRQEKDVKIILGQLIDKSYTAKVAKEVNARLSQQGCISMADLTINYNLPADFLQSTVEKELGKTVFAKQDILDPRIFYTEEFITKNKDKIMEVLNAISKPTTISAVLNSCSISERIFFSIIECLQQAQELPGIITGKQSGQSMYIPNVYSKTQSEWVNNFYKQNGYLEYDALTRLGISDPQSFVRRHFAHDNLVLLDSVAVGSVITDQVDANVEEIISTSSYVDIYPLLPSVFCPEDAESLLKAAAARTRTNIHIFATTVAISDGFLQSLEKSLRLVAEEKAKKAVDSGAWLQFVAEKKMKSRSTENNDTKADKKEERRKKAAGGKSGGGNQGRETKTKSTKKKFHQGKVQELNDSDDEHSVQSSGKAKFTFISTKDIEEELNKDENLACNEDLIKDLVEYLQPKLNSQAMSIVENLMQSSKITNFNEIEERLNMQASNIKIFEKGIKHLDKASQGIMTKYLLKTLGTDFVSDVFKLAAQQNCLQCPANLTNEVRQKILMDLPPDVAEPLTRLNKSLTSSTVEDLLNAADSALASCCLVLKKFDKKREKAIVVGHREALLDQLNATQDPALTLHLVTSILFTAVTQSVLHMSGRHVHSVLAFLQPQIEAEVAKTLSRYHDLVLKLLSTSDNEEKVKVSADLEEGQQKVKDIAHDCKKQIKLDRSHD
ncbi:E3 UFM1-protein ligase 1 homolog [Orussus abietinus]|uniref:E3 UFM1-protein ligase 1 homolog n=1 Tax=Orussus abietinus TaxID=222816 RepID=UPI00062642F0|nr:E3 UFM1-protein ligase 1 homolog [Orussus abietinus]